MGFLEDDLDMFLKEQREGCAMCSEPLVGNVHMGTPMGAPLCPPCADQMYPPKPWDVFENLISQITYKPGWYFRTGIEGDRMWFQVGVTEEAEISFDPIAGKKVAWRGAKHWLSEHMCRNEIVSLVFHAIERAEMHEVREWFRYKKRAIFNPHLDPDALAELASKARNFNTRENAMTMEEAST
jgi:hypothetical protein